jgi:hypothetical protein
MVLSSDVFGDHKADEKIREVKSWLKAKGVTNFEPVSLFCDQLSKVRFRTTFFSKMAHCSPGHGHRTRTTRGLVNEE